MKIPLIPSCKIIIILDKDILFIIILLIAVHSLTVITGREWPFKFYIWNHKLEEKLLLI